MSNIETQSPFAEFDIKLVEKLADDYRKQNWSLQNWILASCLSVNGGGIIFLSSIKEIKLIEKFNPSLMFFIGLCCCILFAMISNQLHFKIQEKILLILVDMNKSDVDVGEYNKLADRIERLDTIADILNYFQYIPLLLFICGGIQVGMLLYDR